MIMLWGRLNATNVQKVVWALEELGLSYKHIPLGGAFGGTDVPDYLEMNPNGLVPTLRDGDLTIWESHAIVRYLAATYGAGSLWPTDAKTRALTDQWADWTATTFQPARIGVFANIVRTPPDKHDAAAIAKAVATTQRCLNILAKRLSAAPYLGGDSPTYADIVAGVALYRWTTIEIQRDDPAAIAAWHDRLNQRAAFRKAVNVNYEDLRVC